MDDFHGWLSWMTFMDDKYWLILHIDYTLSNGRTLVLVKSLSRPISHKVKHRGWILKGKSKPKSSMSCPWKNVGGLGMKEGGWICQVGLDWWASGGGWWRRFLLQQLQLLKMLLMWPERVPWPDAMSDSSSNFLVVSCLSYQIYINK